MPMLQWNQELSINIAEVDAQHSTLVDMVNNLYDSMTAGSDEAVLLNTVNRMANYTVEHFSTEERHMEKYNDPGMPAHKEEHRDFVEKVLQVEEDLKSGRVVLSMDILNFLSSWLVTHINGTDKKMGAFLVENGVS